jgi:hypothetical protein
MKSRTKCFACASRNCNYRIHTESMLFDEIACRRHHHELEVLADSLPELKGVMRYHRISSDRVRRGEPAFVDEPEVRS